MPYSVCGCTQPPSTRVIESVSPKWFSKKGKGKGKADANPRPDLLSREVVDADETHPSEHPSVILVNYEAINEKRSSRNLSTTKRNQEDRRAYLSGKADQWTELIVPRKDRPEHLTSFLTPMSDTHMIDGRCLGHGQCIMVRVTLSSGVVLNLAIRELARLDFVPQAISNKEPLLTCKIGHG